MFTLEFRIDVPLLINFLIFFKPGHSYFKNIQYKKYTCADFFAILQKCEPSVVFFFVSSCKEVKTLFCKLV